MQARLELRRFPTTAESFILALVVALLIGGSVGYVLKPATAVSSPTRTVYVNQAQPAAYDSSGDSCIWVNHHKAC
jgi:hypothetical protein